MDRSDRPPDPGPGFVRSREHGEPIGLARIGDRPLYVGDARAAGRFSVEHELTERFSGDDAVVVSLCRDACPLTTAHHPLHDGPGNEEAEFIAAMDHARELYAAVRSDDRSAGPMLVNCAAGVSRSTTTVAVLLAASEGLSFDAAVDVIEEFRPQANPNPALATLARSYLADVPGVPESDSPVESLKTPPPEELSRPPRPTDEGE